MEKTNVTLPGEQPKPEENPPPQAEKPAEKPKPAAKPAAKPQNGSPFVPAKRVNKRLKLFLWGESGVGKTTLSLQFPGVAMIDAEDGAELYGDDFEFSILAATSPDEIMAAVDWLLKNKHGYRTLVIDPVTVYWEALQKKWSEIFLRRNRGSKGYKFEFYDMQPKDWGTVKSEFKEFIRKLIALDMNVIVTAREKTKYSSSEFMQTIGETFDGERTLPYLFDTIVRLYRDGSKFMGKALKDRSNKLPKEFECSYGVFHECFGAVLHREAEPVAVATKSQLSRLRGLIKKFEIDKEALASRLEAYDAETIEDLTKENAQIIIDKLQAALAAKEA